MRDWMFYQIENALRARREELFKETIDFADLIKREALEEAESGDVTKLRELFPPEFRPFISPRPRKRGEKYRRRPNYSRVVLAKKLVPLIQEIWRKHYDGRWRRQHDDGPDAYEIAADYYGVDDDEAVRRKASGRRKKKGRAK